MRSSGKTVKCYDNIYTESQVHALHEEPVHIEKHSASQKLDLFKTSEWQRRRWSTRWSESLTQFIVDQWQDFDYKTVNIIDQ